MTAHEKAMALLFGNPDYTTNSHPNETWHLGPTGPAWITITIPQLVNIIEQLEELEK